MADILPFPARSEDRLRAALRSLDAALAEQNEALAEFRGNLSLLKGAVSGLDSSVHAYRDTLARTADDVAGANAAAKRLERTADIWLKG